MKFPTLHKKWSFPIRISSVNVLVEFKQENICLVCQLKTGKHRPEKVLFFDLSIIMPKRLTNCGEKFFIKMFFFKCPNVTEGKASIHDAVELNLEIKFLCLFHRYATYDFKEKQWDIKIQEIFS